MQLYAWKLYWLQCRPVFHQQYILEIELKLAARNRSGRFLKKTDLRTIGDLSYHQIMTKCP